MRNSRGISTIEVLVVVAILALLFVVLFQYLSPQISKSRDSRRKSDLSKIKVAYENYFNDNGCYPDPDMLDNCNGEDLKPYLSAIPCDPQTKQPYVYLPESNQCAGYRILAVIEVGTDPVIEQLNCTAGCGGIPESDPEYADRDQYKYGVSEGVPVSTAEDTELEMGVVCDAGTCNICDNSGNPCSSYPEIYETYDDCRATGCR